MKKLTDSCKTCKHKCCPPEVNPCRTCRFLNGDYRTYNHVLRENTTSETIKKEIEFTEEQARNFFKDLYWGKYETEEDYIMELISKGYIKKSELEIRKHIYYDNAITDDKEAYISKKVADDYIKELEKALN